MSETCMMKLKSLRARSFSPLLIGSMSETCMMKLKSLRARSFSPLLIGSMSETDRGRHSWISPRCLKYLGFWNCSRYYRIKRGNSQ
jgi:hypothetical protein